MTLKEHYYSLPAPVAPKLEFVSRVAERCGVNEATVRNWIRGSTKPGEERHYDILVEETGISKEELFSDGSN